MYPRKLNTTDSFSSFALKLCSVWCAPVRSMVHFVLTTFEANERATSRSLEKSQCRTKRLPSLSLGTTNSKAYSTCTVSLFLLTNYPKQFSQTLPARPPLQARQNEERRAPTLCTLGIRPIKNQPKTLANHLTFRFPLMLLLSTTSR